MQIHYCLILFPKCKGTLMQNTYMPQCEVCLIALVYLSRVVKKTKVFQNMALLVSSVT